MTSTPVMKENCSADFWVLGERQDRFSPKLSATELELTPLPDNSGEVVKGFTQQPWHGGKIWKSHPFQRLRSIVHVLKVWEDVGSWPVLLLTLTSPRKRNTGQKLRNQMAVKSVLVLLEGAASGMKTHGTVISVSVCYSCINKVPSARSIIHKHHVVRSFGDWETPNESARRLTSQLRVYSSWMVLSG